MATKATSEVEVQPIKEAPLPTFPKALMENANPKSQREKMQADFAVLESELLGMKIEMAEVPTTESLVKLYGMQAKGRAYYERSEEIFRQYLKFLSTITLICQKVDFVMKQETQVATAWTRENKAAELRNTKSGEERNALIALIIPPELFKEQMEWHLLESQAKTNFTILKSYRDQFKSINDNVLIQLSIFKNLIMLGELKMDPEAMRAMRIIEASYVPTQQDVSERQPANYVPEVSAEEGYVQL